jgi:hypothetical protein
MAGQPDESSEGWQGRDGPLGSIRTYPGQPALKYGRNVMDSRNLTGRLPLTDVEPDEMNST